MRPLALLCLIAASGSLGGCGFSPVYGKHEAGSGEPNLRAALESTQFEPIENSRAAQLLSIAIEDALHPQGPTGAARRYMLRMDLPTVEEIPVSVETSQFVARTNLRLNVRVRLMRAADNQQIFSAILRRISSFNTSITSDYSTVVARDDAIKRGATALGSDVAMRVQAALSRELMHPLASGTPKPEAPMVPASPLPSAFSR